MRASPSGMILCLACLFLPGLAGDDFTEADDSIEYRVKAAYLLNFARYVEWPPAAFLSDSEPLTVCVAGSDPFGAVLDQTFEGHMVGGRAVVGRRVSGIASATGCHILFIPGPEALPLETAAAGSRSVLTVGESISFLSAGGMVRFLVVEDSIRFEVNNDAAQRAGLKISSRMLSFAFAVRDPG